MPRRDNPDLLPDVGEPTPKDVAVSRALAECTEPKKRECYRNSVLAMQLADVLSPGVLYVEGWYICRKLSQPFVMHHGWLYAKTPDHPEGAVIDPTLPDDPGEYYPVHTFTTERVVELVGEYGFVPFTPALPPKERVESHTRGLALWDLLRAERDAGGGA